MLLSPNLDGVTLLTVPAAITAEVLPALEHEATRHEPEPWMQHHPILLAAMLKGRDDPIEQERRTRAAAIIDTARKGPDGELQLTVPIYDPKGFFGDFCDQGEMGAGDNIGARSAWLQLAHAYQEGQGGPSAVDAQMEHYYAQQDALVRDPSGVSD